MIVATKQQLDRMIDNKLWTMGLTTPNGIRKIIDSEAKFNSLKLLQAEVNELAKKLAIELTRRYWIDDREAIRALQKSYVSEL